MIGTPDIDGDGLPRRPGYLAVDADDALLVSDFSQQRIVRISDGAASVVGQRVILVGNGANAGFSPHTDLLIKVRQWDELWALGR